MAFIVPHGLPSESVADLPLLDLLSAVLPHRLIQEVIADHRHRFIRHATRTRRLPGELLLPLLIARYLLPGMTSFDGTLDALLATVR